MKRLCIGEHPLLPQQSLYPFQLKACPPSVWRIVLGKSMNCKGAKDVKGFKVHPTLTKENMHYVVEQVKEVLAHTLVK